MISSDTKAFREDRARELKKLAEFFSAQKFARSVQPLQKAATECRAGSSLGDNQWGYRIDRLIFPVRNDEAPYPSDAYDTQIELNLAVTGPCVPETIHHDPLTSLEAGISVTARSPSKSDLLCCWHFDRHIGNPTGAGPAAAHPRYHMHFGGFGMTKSSLDFGATLIMPGPRLAQPPLDGVLFVDFVLSNFLEHCWQHARRQSRYVDIVKDAQKRLWKPYSRSIGCAWTKPTPSEWAPTDVWPHFHN